MLDSILIKNFKAIGAEGLTLSGLNKVNYLVGKNGCGKSSVLEGLNMNATKLSESQKSEIVITYKDSDVKHKINFSKENDKINYLEEVSNSIGVHSQENPIWRRFPSIIFIKLDSINQKIIEDENFEHKSMKSRLNYIEKIKFYSDGEYKHNLLRSNIISCLAHKRCSTDSISDCLFLIEEPENNLDPHWHKKIANELAGIGQIIVSTHSPFIISAAAGLTDQKVYLIEDGRTVYLAGNKGKGEKGYAGGECLLAVNKMLGSDLTDLATNIIFCEKSLCCLFIELFKTHKPKKHFSFTPQCSGQDYKIFENLKLAYKYNLNNLNIYGIIDNEPNAIKKVNDIKTKTIDYNLPKEQFESLQSDQLAVSRLFISQSGELELLYSIDQVNIFLTSKNLPIWDKLAHLSFSQDYLKQKLTNGKSIKSEHPNIKNELAECMGSILDASFINTISPDLHALLFP